MKRAFEHILVKSYAKSKYGGNRVLLAGGIAGSLDLTYAMIAWSLYGARPIVVPQAIAGGLLGPATFSGGWATGLLGVGLHFSIATMMALTYYLASRKLSSLAQRPVPWGAAYGLLCYVVMNYIVVPLSAAMVAPPPMSILVTDILAHVFVVGIPIALIVTCAPKVSAR